MAIGAPALTTTTVCGLAAATSGDQLVLRRGQVEAEAVGGLGFGVVGDDHNRGLRGLGCGDGLGECQDARDDGVPQVESCPMRR